MKSIKVAALLIGLMLTAGGCNDFLKEENKSNMVSDEYYATSEGYEKLINAAYSSMRSVYSQPWVFCAGTDMYVEGRSQQPVGLSEYQNLIPDDGEVLNFYTNVYQSIQVCNTALYFNDKTASTSTLANRKGEIQFLRAYDYFLLVQTFGGVALVTDRFTQPVESFSRASAQEVYAFIIKEMTEALELVPETTPNFGRVTKRAVRHMLAKIHLTRGYESFGTADDFKTAATYADAAIQGQGLTLSFEDVFFPGNEKNAEILFSIQWDAASLPTANSGGNTQAAYFGPYFGGQGGVEGYPYRTYTLCPTMYTFDLFTETDARFDATFMIQFYQRYYDYYTRRTERNQLNVKYYYPPKWANSPAAIAAWKAADPTRRNNAVVYPYSGTLWEASRTVVLDNYTPSVKKFDDPSAQFGSNTSTRDLFVARLGETYLLAAEAYFKMGNLALAADRINVVRKRAAKSGAETSMQIQSSDVTLDFILDERGRELVGEYHRWFDLKRTGTLMTRARMYNKDVRKWFDNGIDPFMGAGNQPKLLRPIPTRALDLNQGAFAQNPGY
ncbi:RagB/SusD family nutrient uptake outer membrane protein [Siphonobacter sp. BAB-5405]|uniref:RagB/SusD family nutrient uptake outer membrane protein n=1 Tax=Siphonobacter sp. BAB-5405 TaxID=1864825 RepID=UPI000C8004A8|nr:RagB/SusD family nutrient uptake outer membrane protein [Siphonobacter sp. BAB-5405]PMD92525.1 RagB/SusD family nutrient uptake outer membrane protein [Siphonobacter sp. BAB-5405]